MRYAIVIEKAENNFAAYVPDLPGCVATGKTVEETEQQIREAIGFHIRGLREDGLPIPDASSRADYVEIADDPTTSVGRKGAIDDYFQNMLLVGANEIRQRLRVDEERYDRFGRVHNQRGRDHYVYAVLDEIEQLGIVLSENKEFFDNIPESTPSDEHGRRITRNVLLTVERGQSLYTRRLVETLSELINFSHVNTNAYFDHYLLYKELDQYKKRSLDFRIDFEITNSNTQEAIEHLKFSIAHAENSIQLDRCWYLKTTKVGSPNPHGEAALQTFQGVFNLALSRASRAERIVMGSYYGDAFRLPSRAIHLNIGGVQRTVSFDWLRAQRGQMSVLGLHCLLRCRRLVGMRSRTGFGAQIARVLNDISTGKQKYRTGARPKISKGDFVVVAGRLCEVMATRKSRYGHRSVRVHYLSTPLTTEKEDWFPADNVTKFIDGEKQRRGVIQRLRSWGATPLSPRRIRVVMRETALEVWDNLNARDETPTVRS